MAIRRYVLTLTAVGPIHVGDGSTIGNKEYFVKERDRKDVVAVLDPEKFVSHLSGDQIDAYCDFLQASSRKGLQEFLRERTDLAPIAEKSILYETEASLSHRRGGGYQFFDVKRFVKDAYGCPYIPGSSLKGALRTALLSCLIADDPGRFAKVLDKQRDRGRWVGKDYEKQSLWVDVPDPGNPKERHDIMRYISVSDSASLSTDDLVFAKKYDLFSKRDSASHKRDMGNLSDASYYQGNELNIYRECVKPGTEISFTVDVDSRIDSYLPEGYVLDEKGIEKILAASYALYKHCFLDDFDIDQEESQNDDGQCSYTYQSGPLAGSRCRNHAVDGTGYCGVHSEYAGQGNAPKSDSQTFCYIGGGTDYAIKTIANALFADDDKRVQEIAHILFAQFPSKVDRDRHPRLTEDIEDAGFAPKPFTARFYANGRVKKAKEDHRHWQSAELGVAPHTLKLGIIGSAKYPFGKCEVRVEQR